MFVHNMRNVKQKAITQWDSNLGMHLVYIFFLPHRSASQCLCYVSLGTR